MLKRVIEIVLAVLGVLVVKRHLSPRIRIFSCAAGYGKNGIARVKEWTFDRNLPSRDGKRPQALIGLTRRDANVEAQARRSSG
jgi:hypothetical protein